MIEIKVPARICFFGDHQDYLGLPVIAGAINRFIVLTAEPNKHSEFVIELIDLNKTVTISINDDLLKIQEGDYFRSGMAVLIANGFELTKGYTIQITGNIPVNAGLSSSSALVVAWIRFLATSQDPKITINDSQIGQWAYEAEVRYFEQPGGLMDQYTIAHRGLLAIDTQTVAVESLQTTLGKLVVAESGLPKRTLQVLKNARAYAQKAVAAVRKKHPNFNLKESQLSDYKKYKNIVPEKYREHWYAALYNYDITLKARSELKKQHPNLLTLGNLMNRHQKILQDQIGNTPLKMVNMMKAALDAGAYGAKIIGSGGGGCMVAMAKMGKEANVVDAFVESGAKLAYEVTLVYS